MTSRTVDSGVYPSALAGVQAPIRAVRLLRPVAQLRELPAELRHFRRDHRHAVALVRIALEVSLVVRLGRVPVAERDDLGDDRRVEDGFAFEPLDRLPRFALLVLVDEEDRRAILRPDV